MENKKFEVNGNGVLYRELVNLIHETAEQLDRDAYFLTQNQTFQSLDIVMRGIEELHAFAGNMMAFLRYKAFTLDVVSESDSVEESEVQKAE